jgi:hypothetical protein
MEQQEPMDWAEAVVDPQALGTPGGEPQVVLVVVV